MMADVDEFLVEHGDANPQGNTLAFNTWLLDTRDATAESRFGAIMYGGLDGTSDMALAADQGAAGIEGASVELILNSTAYHAAPVFVSSVYETILKIVGGDDVSLTSRYQTLPATERQTAINAGLSTIFPIMMILLGFPFIPSAFVMFVVREKENKSKHIQLVSGVSPIAFWLSTWMWDALSYMLPMWGTLGLLQAYVKPRTPRPLAAPALTN
jgi:hypothetical protein